MRNLTCLTVLLFAINTLNAQNYKITFKGTGDSTLVDSVEVQNLTRETFIILPGTDTLLLSGTIGIEETNTGVPDLLVYPNPSSQTARIRFGNSGPGRVEIEVCEITGKIILTKDYTLPRATHIFTVSGLKTGIYLIQVKTSKETYAERLIVSVATGDAPEILYEGSINYEFHPKNYKRTGNVAVMHYKDGERLLFKAHSSRYTTVMTLVPDKSQQLAFEFFECTDADSNHYAVVRIGWQIWMAENLKTTRYENGQSLYYEPDANDWGDLVGGAYCWHNNDEATYKNLYGGIYNFYAAADYRNVCPAGWIVPADWSWDILTNHLGENAGGKMKSTGTSLWLSSNEDATNESGFTGLPGGARNLSGIFGDTGDYGHWWSSTNNDFTTGWHRLLYRANGYVGKSSYNKSYGFSIRCMKSQ